MTNQTVYGFLYYGSREKENIAYIVTRLTDNCSDQIYATLHVILDAVAVKEVWQADEETKGLLRIYVGDEWFNTHVAFRAYSFTITEDGTYHAEFKARPVFPESSDTIEGVN